MPSCGKRVFTMSPVRWEPISMSPSFDSFAEARERSIQLLMPTRTAVVNRPRNRLPADSESMEWTLAEFGYPRATTRTAFLSKVAMPAGFKHCWRQLCHDISCSSRALHQPGTMPVPRHRAGDRARDWLDQSVSRLRNPSPPGGQHPEKLCA